jgi:N-acetylneuraminic acid mutarotase
VVHGGTAYVIGGYDGHAPLRDVLATTDGQHFRVVAQLLAGVRYPSVVVVGNAIYVLGGETSGGDTADVQRIDLANGRTSVVGHLPAPLAHAGAGAIGDRIVLAGGRRAGSPTALVETYDVRSGTTTAVGSLPEALTDPASAVVAGALWLFGGEHGNPVDTVLRIG